MKIEKDLEDLEPSQFKIMFNGEFSCETFFDEPKSPRRRPFSIGHLHFYSKGQGHSECGYGSCHQRLIPYFDTISQQLKL